MLSNPPYGKTWKTDAEKWGKRDILDSRFNGVLADGTQLTMIPRVSDGQLLFLLNNVAKMKTDTPSAAASQRCTMVLRCLRGMQVPARAMPAAI